MWAAFVALHLFSRRPVCQVHSQRLLRVVRAVLLCNLHRSNRQGVRCQASLPAAASASAVAARIAVSEQFGCCCVIVLSASCSHNYAVVFAANTFFGLALSSIVQVSCRSASEVRPHFVS